MEKEKRERLQIISDIMFERVRGMASTWSYAKTLRPYDEAENMNMREAHFIVAIGPGKGKTMSEIAKALGVSHGAVSQMATKLEDKGYMVRVHSNENRRITTAMLTEKGEKLYYSHLAYDNERYENLDNKFINAFTEDELETVLKFEKMFSDYFNSNYGK